MTEKEICESGHKGDAAWLANRLKIEEMQYVFSSSLSKTSDFDTKNLMQVIASSTGQEGWVPFNTGSKEGHRLEALTAPRQD